MRQITRALDILDHLAARGDSSLAELTAELALPRASVHRMLHTLEQRAYVHHAASERVYRLGPAIAALAARGRQSPPSFAPRAPRSHGCGRAHGGDDQPRRRQRLADHLRGDGRRHNQPRMSASVGAQVEPTATALGKAILSRLPSELRDRLLPPPPYPRYTPATITRPRGAGRRAPRRRDQRLRGRGGGEHPRRRLPRGSDRRRYGARDRGHLDQRRPGSAARRLVRVGRRRGASLVRADRGPARRRRRAPGRRSVTRSFDGSVAHQERARKSLARGVATAFRAAQLPVPI